MNFNLAKSVVPIVIKNAVAAGTTNQTCTLVDMAGYDGVMCVAEFGTLTAGQVTSLKAQGCTDSGGGGNTDLKGTSTGPMADGDSNKTLVLDIFRPAAYRWISFIVLRGTQNAVINNVIAYLYKTSKLPAVPDASNSATKVVVSPVAGTP